MGFRIEYVPTNFEFNSSPGWSLWQTAFYSPKGNDDDDDDNDADEDDADEDDHWYSWYFAFLPERLRADELSKLDHDHNFLGSQHRNIDTKWKYKYNCIFGLKSFDCCMFRFFLKLP